PAGVGVTEHGLPWLSGPARDPGSRERALDDQVSGIAVEPVAVPRGAVVEWPGMHRGQWV
ncbi:MAG TPA: hypothetical protein VMK16_07875, partial [Acidimicrobiales bacterium]|nr:hypothetical protein [Acidimicrobiales bacterium]